MLGADRPRRHSRGDPDDRRTDRRGHCLDPERIAERYWEVVQMDAPWQAEFRFTGE